MTMTTAEIVALFHQRRTDSSTHKNRARELEAIYDGTVTVPLPELDKDERPAITNWIVQGLDQMAMRVASVTPAVICPPTRIGIQKAEDNAKTRRRAITGWWEQNRFDLQLSKRARWLVGYASAPAIIRPDPKRGIPVWELRDPRSAYPAPNPDPTGLCPEDCIFAVKRSYGWLLNHFPRAAASIEVSSQPRSDKLYECLEYIDADEHVLVVLGNPEVTRAQPPWAKSGQKAQGPAFVELTRFENKVGRCTAVIPQRISLNMPRGQFDELLGLYRTQARAMALWLVATERAIFPDTWFISRPNETVSVLQIPDGRAGVPGEVRGGDLKEIAPVSSPQVMEMLQLLEQAQMRTGGIPMQLGGEMPSNVRTGKAGDQVLGNTIDYFVQEAQKTLGYALREENSLAIDTARAYFGNQRKTFYVSFAKVQGQADYVPNKDFDSNANIVAWPHAGADVNSLVIGIGQRLGLGEISKRTARILDPYVDDPDLEDERCNVESMEQALLAAINQAIISGQIGPLEVGQMVQLVSEESKTIWGAYQTVHEKIQAQAQQAQQAMAAAQGGGPGGGAPPGGGQPGAGPGAPGLMAPGVAAQMPFPSAGNPSGGGVAAPGTGVQHMSTLMGALRPRKVA